MKGSAIDQLRNGTFPADWTYNILEDKAAFTGKKTPEWAFNGDCNKGLNPEEVFAKWQQVSKVKNRTTGTLRTVTKNGLGVLTGPAGGYLIAVDIDGLEAEAVFEAFMGQDYPSIDAPGTMSWRGKPTNRQLLYRMPEGHRQFFEKMIREQLDEDLKKGGNSEVCIRYGGCYSVLPGSYHPDTQGQYSWLSYNGGKVADLPDRILCWLMNHHSQQSETYVPAELMESLEQGMDKAPLSGKNVKQLARDFKIQILQPLVNTDHQGQETGPDDPNALVWQFYKADVWKEDRQPLAREHGNPEKPLVGGCPFHDSQSGTSFTLWPDQQGEGKEKGRGLFGWLCHKERVGGGAIKLLHALRTGDIDAGWPNAATLEEYCIEGAKLLGKTYPDDFQAAVSFKREVTYDAKEKSTLEWARWIEKTFENPAEQSIEFARLASDHQLRWGTEQIYQALQDDHDFRTAAGPQNCTQRREGLVGLDFVIPDLLLTPSVICLHGGYGTGKSQTAAAIAKHILQGRPFKVRGADMPVRKGTVLWCNGDQSREIFENQLESHGINEDPNFYSWPKFRLKWQRRFYQKLNDLKPQLVIIDSLSGCMPLVDNNKQEISKPLRDLEVDNGTEFPSCSILILHHNNRQGGFRGHSSIGDAVTETWALDKPNEDECKEDAYGPDTEMRRIITIGKSRIGRENDKLVTLLHDDDSLDIEDFTPVERKRKYSGKTPVIDLVHSFIRTQTTRGESTTRKELEVSIGRRATASTLRSALNRLKTRRLIQSAPGPAEGRRGAPESHWFACTEHGLELLERLNGAPREERGGSSSHHNYKNTVHNCDLNNVAGARHQNDESGKSTAKPEKVKRGNNFVADASLIPTQTEQGPSVNSAAHPPNCNALNLDGESDLDNVANSETHREGTDRAEFDLNSLYQHAQFDKNGLDWFTGDDALTKS